MIVFFNNKFCVGDLWYDKNLGYMYEYVLEWCGMNIIMEFYKIGNVFEMFKNVFVLKIGNIY